MIKNQSTWFYAILLFVSLAFGVIGCSSSTENDSESLSSAIAETDELEKGQASSPAGVVPSVFSTDSEKWAKGRILVQPRMGVDDEQLAKILSAQGGKSIGIIQAINVHIVELPANANEKAVANLLAHNPNLEFAEVDGIVAPVLTTNDTYYSSQWHLPKVNAPAAWDHSKGSGVVIAILDSGVDGTHPDLASRMVPGYNFYDNNTNTTDVHGHGTWCAGTAAAIGNNALGVAGVAWEAQIMPVRISDTTGYAYWSTIATGINWAADNGAKVASISYQAHLGSTVSTAAQYFQSKGGVVVNSAGNTGALDSTANSPYLISVSATDSGDVKTNWSTYGPYVDLSAPGTSIYTTARGGGYATVQGTSFSCPITAGTAALMFSVNPSLSPTQIQNILFSTAKDLGAVGYDQYYGYGRVDAGAAVLLAKNTVGNDTQAPTVSITSPQNGAIVKGLLNVDVSASDNIGVTRVDLFINGVLVGSDTLSPYNFSLDSTTRNDGVYNLTAQAYDATGNMKTSNPVTITIDNIVDTVAPIVTISNPVDGSTVKSGNVNISATATDNETVKSMTIIIDGVTKATSSSGSISYTWNTRKVASGTHTIQVNATDASGNIGTKIIQVKK